MADSQGGTMLIAGPPFRGYLRMIGDAFKACGIQPSLLEWEYPERSFSQELRFYSSAGFRSKLADAQDRANALALEKTVLELDPDNVLVVKAVELTDRTKQHCMQSGAKLVLWAYDSAAYFPIISRAAPRYDLVYTYEPADLDMLSKTCSPKLLPMAYDPRYYSPRPDRPKKDLDIAFVGAIDPYPQRRRLLKRISSAFRDRTIAVWTDTVHWYSHRKLRDVVVFGPRRNIDIHRETLEHAAVSDVYNRSRVCLNVHHVQSVRAVNPRTFEILGSGSLLVTDRGLGDIEGFEAGDGYVHYASDDELIAKLRSVLDDEDKARYISDVGHSEVRAHTYEKRARTILSDLR